MGHVGQEPGRVALQLLQEHAVRRDLRLGLSVRRARHRDADRQRRAVPGQADHPDVVAEVLAAELRADAEPAGQLQHLLLQVPVAEGVPHLGTGLRQRVQVARRRQLRDLEGELRRHPADDDRQVVGRARRRTQRAQLLVEEGRQPLRVQQRLGLLVQEGLVGRPAALGHHQQLVARGGARHAVQLDLRGQVRAGVALVPERRGRHLRVAQVEGFEGLEDPAGDRLLVVPAGQHGLGALADDDRRAGVLTHRQHPARGDAGVAQQVRRDEAVVRRRLGVVDDRAQLGEVRRAQQVGDVADGGAHQRGQRRGRDLEELAAECGDVDQVACREVETAVLGGVGAQGQHVGVVELGHSVTIRGDPRRAW